MEIKDADDLTEYVKVQLSSLSTLITDTGYELVCEQAIQELGWSYPVTNPTKLLWLIKRATRYALNILLIASANKFKYKLVNLQHRFDHFKSLIDTMDKEFETALSSDVALFAGVETFRMFGTKVDAGFSYDANGKDITYQLDKYVNFSPLEN
ncbi:MAG: hypothetical protein LLG05_09580 [Porphyromonadaceae bacterium]|nr:hypothetical protein [Porphyromonadaceae bacterium]